MDYRDREQIDRCCNEISPKIKMCFLWPRLLANEVFDHDDVNVSRWENILDQEDTIRDILDTIKTRGPYAFKNLVRSLRETHHDQVADVLEGKQTLVTNESALSNNGKSLHHTLRSSNTAGDWYNTEFLTSNKPLVIDVRHASKFMDEPDDSPIGKYCMRKRPHGYVLIITVKAYITLSTRIAAERDEENLKKLFEGMGFDVTVPDPGTALTGAEINRIVKEFSQRDFHKVDSCFVVISAHGSVIEGNGGLDTAIHGIDYNLPGAERVLCGDLIEMFSAENCEHLREKPKIFIFQACRVKAKQTARYAEDGMKLGKVQNYSDILIAHSTMPGQVAYRNEHAGSWYISVLCDVFMRYACTMPIDDLFKMVNEILKKILTEDGMEQTPTVKFIGFNKSLFLNPGIFEDS